MGTHYGEPADVDGECNARLFIGDNFGDNHATMRCAREPQHLGNHVEEFEHNGNPVRIEWEQDERATKCAMCEAPLTEPTDHDWEICGKCQKRP